jgi:xanthine dehydrogenase large subunit
MGWLTTEELWWDAKGRLRTHAPSTYKIPLASDRPRSSTSSWLNGRSSREETIRRSKAVGEPPFMLPMSVLKQSRWRRRALPSIKIAPRLDAPATPERVLLAIERLRRAAKNG